MNFSFRTVVVCSRNFAKRFLFAQTNHVQPRRSSFRLIGLPGVTLTLGLLFNQCAVANGDPVKGAESWDYLCDHCHGTPQPNNSAAFKAYGTTANPLSLYASNPAAITKAINAGYTIPKGNTNNDYEPGSSTALAMGSFVGMGPKRMGVGETPTQYAMDISAYLASYFEVPEIPTISKVVAGNGLANVTFTAPKSDLPIASYTVTANPGGITSAGAVSPITVSGLTNGTAYTFTIAATSNAGTSKTSSASSAVTPVGAAPAPAPAVAVTPKPLAPVAATAVAAPAVVAVAKAAAPVIPAATVATNHSTAASAVAPVTAVAPKPVVPVAVSTAAAPAIVAAVKTAVPVIATAPLSAPTSKPAAPVQPIATTTPATASSTQLAPTIIAAKPGSAEARVFFTVPQDVLALISSYTVVAYSGGKATGINATGPSSPLKITGLTNGTEYVFYVFANAKSGARVPSAVSNVVTPLSIFGD